MKIAFIGFGEAGRAFASSLREVGRADFSAYDILTEKGADAALREAAEALGVEVAASPAEAIAGADWVVSAVTAAQSLDAGRAAAPHLTPGQTFIDINSVSAGRKIETAAIVSANGAAYIDMAVMAPVHPRGHRTPVLVAGPTAEALSGVFTELGFDFDVAGEEVGAATSVKMIRSLFVKGLEAITVQALLAARQAGCLERIAQSLAASFPGLGWPDFARYELERVATHGVRRAEEMEESARSMADLGFAAGHDLALATAALQNEIGRLGVQVAPGAELEEALREIASRR